MGCGSSVETPNVELTMTDIALIEKIAEDYVSEQPIIKFVAPASYAAQKKVAAPDAGLDVVLQHVVDDETPCNKLAGAPSAAKDWPVRQVLSEYRQTVAARATARLEKKLSEQLKKVEADDQLKVKAVKRAIANAADVVVLRDVMSLSQAGSSGQTDASQQRSRAISLPATAAQPHSPDTRPAPNAENRSATPQVATQPHGGASTAPAPAATTTGASPGNNAAATTATASPSGSPNSVARADDADLAHPLPDGAWRKQGDTGFYYCDDQELYYFPAAGHFFDPASDMWFVPDTDQWLDKTEHDKLLEKLQAEGKY